MSDLVRIMGTAQEAEASLISSVLRSHQIEVVIKRDAGQDVPGLLGGGRRQIMVPRDQAEQAAQILADMAQNSPQEDLDDAGEARGVFSSGRRSKGVLMLAMFCLPVTTILVGAAWVINNWLS